MLDVYSSADEILFKFETDLLNRKSIKQLSNFMESEDGKKKLEKVLDVGSKELEPEYYE